MKFTTVAQYIAAQPKEARAALEAVRRAIRVVEGVEEGIAYDMPTYKLGGVTVLHFAGWKEHYSLYPATDGVLATFHEDLERYEVNDKGTMRFPLAQPVPSKLIERIAKFRAKEVRAKDRSAPKAAKAKSKTTARAPRPKE